jgi:precorrin-8X/cobalt-precorrin-8 methylmutase
MVADHRSAGYTTELMSSYEKDGSTIYKESFRIIRAEADLSRFSPVLSRTVVRMIHACGMTDLAADVIASPGAAEAGADALLGGASILCDSEMVAVGITRKRLPAANQVICTLHDPRVLDLSIRHGTTRSAAAVELWGQHLAGSVVAIGNAPTALFHLLDMLKAGAARPALIVGVPVGFVGAAESKAALAQHSSSLRFITVRGRRGGSAITSAAVNALASEQE